MTREAPNGWVGQRLLSYESSGHGDAGIGKQGPGQAGAVVPVGGSAYNGPLTRGFALGLKKGDGWPRCRF